MKYQVLFLCFSFMLPILLPLFFLPSSFLFCSLIPRLKHHTYIHNTSPLNRLYSKKGLADRLSCSCRRRARVECWGLLGCRDTSCRGNRAGSTAGREREKTTQWKCRALQVCVLKNGIWQRASRIICDLCRIILESTLKNRIIYCDVCGFVKHEMRRSSQVSSDAGSHKDESDNCVGGQLYLHSGCYYNICRSLKDAEWSWWELHCIPTALHWAPA